jgi:hypothetical protein
LRDLTNALLQLPHPERAISELFAVMERLPDSDLGTPGPLVHTLERLKGYEEELISSVRRLPTPLAVWMLNRILNTPLPRDQRAHYLQLLQHAARHPTAPSEATSSAEDFIERQNERMG